MEPLKITKSKSIFFLLFFSSTLIFDLLIQIFFKSTPLILSTLLTVTVSLVAIVQSLAIRKSFRILRKERTSLERALHSQEGYLKLFFETAKDSIAVFDLDSKIIDVNPAFEELYGWSRKDIIGKRIPLIPPHLREEASNRLEKLLKGDSFKMLETVDMKKNGTYFDAQISLSPIYNQVGEMIAMSVISRDISYRIKTEKMMIQSEKLKLVGEIAAGVAHEIRNPMTVISGFIQLMNSDEKNPYNVYTDLIQSELERINLIISEFLVLSKPQATNKEVISVSNLLKNIVLLFEPELNLQGIQCTLKICANKNDIFGERDRLKQVFINILKNAIEASKPGGNILISTELIEKKRIKILIKDEGEGISPEIKDKIFEPFFTTKQKGTGLGMVISEKIIRQHDGQLQFDSVSGVGSTVTITLPAL